MLKFPIQNFSSRSPIYSTKGCVASSQPIASEVGMEILKRGGNAADAAVGMAAALNVTEPGSTGIGGDAFCLFYDAKSQSVKGLNGSGRAPKKLTAEFLLSSDQLGPFAEQIPFDSAHAVTVPGTVKAWEDTLLKFGTMSLSEVLKNPIKIAENGFPVSPISAEAWKISENLLKKYSNEMLLNERAPNPGEIMKLPNLANTFKQIAKDGSQAFYTGKIASNIVETLNKLGSLLSLEDLESHKTTFDPPISINYRGIDIWEMPPNGQGITALLGLNTLETFEIGRMEYHSTEHLHALIESTRLAFSDTRYYVTDPEFYDVPIKELLSKEYSTKRKNEYFLKDKRNEKIKHGYPTSHSNTVYLSVVDEQGNACSFINSNYHGFGTGIIPPTTGFTLQNRGCGFSLDKNHPNFLKGGKRTYHTIIPGMATKNGKLWASFGVMGGFMQPQGHMQVISNMVDFGMDPQRALDSPRYCISSGETNGLISFETGISQKTILELEKMGHNVDNQPLEDWDRKVFGNGQIIRKIENGTCAGSDLRADGVALGCNF